MLTELRRQLRRYEMVQPGDTVICAVSGGADSIALLLGLYLLREELEIRLEAVHFNHGLRGAESDGDEAFVREFCSRYDIALYVGSGTVVSGRKGLEAAAREARYAYFATLDGKIATAHTADDNAETVLMHLVRGTGLKGLGGIAPINGTLIRPLLNCTRQQVLDFLEEYHVSYRSDSSNATDEFFRNRLRHHVMPLLTAENPRLTEKVSAMAQRLRQDEEALAQAADFEELPSVCDLRRLPAAVRSRMLERFLKESGVREPEAEHIALVESLVFSDRPSARGQFPGGIIVTRNYDRLQVLEERVAPKPVILPIPGVVELPDWGLRVRCEEAGVIENSTYVFTVCPTGPLCLRGRNSGDTMVLHGGRKLLKKLYVDRKIPAYSRCRIPVIVDQEGVLGVGGIGVNLDRAAGHLPAVRICIEEITMEDSQWKR